MRLRATQALRWKRRLPRMRWTPAALEAVRQRIALGRTAREVAKELGCSYAGMIGALNDAGMAVRQTRSQPVVQFWMERYGVSRRVVERIGVERLKLMTEDARRVMLRPDVNGLAAVKKPVKSERRVRLAGAMERVA